MLWIIRSQLRIPENGVVKNKEFVVRVPNDATFVEALAMVDKLIFKNSELSPFSKNHVFVRSYLQLFWNPEENELYSDIDVFAASSRGFMPLQKNIKFNLYDDSEISLTSSA